MVVPLQKPIRGVDGTLMHEVPVSKGTPVFTNFAACNTAKDIWGDDAAEWKPDRWLAPLPPSVAEAQIPGVSSNMWEFTSFLWYPLADSRQILSE